MNILIANVRNLEAPELRVLAGELCKNHRVTVCAMDNSARQKGNAFSYSGFPIKYKQITSYNLNGEKIPAYKFQGNPADMISIMLGSIMRHKKPQLVICGISNGISLGTDVFCSSNIGMAMQAAFANVPCITVGIPHQTGGHSEAVLQPVAQFIAKNVEKFAKLKMPTDTFLNISLPLVEKYSDYQGVGVASMDNLTRLTRYVEKTDNNGNQYFWTEKAVRETAKNAPLSPTAGMAYFQKKYIIMSPLTYDCTDYHHLQALQGDKQA